MTLLETLMISHLCGDWLFQTHNMAIRKTKEWKIRAVHCAVYSSLFFWYLPWYWILYLFITHFVIDSYIPLFQFRKLRGDFKTMEEFKESFNTPAGFFVNVAMDQIFHVMTFLPIIWWS